MVEPTSWIVLADVDWHWWFQVVGDCLAFCSVRTLTTHFSRNALILLTRPTSFELMTPWFEARL